MLCENWGLSVLIKKEQRLFFFICVFSLPQSKAIAVGREESLSPGHHLGGLLVSGDQLSLCRFLIQVKCIFQTIHDDLHGSL